MLQSGEGIAVLWVSGRKWRSERGFNGFLVDSCSWGRWPEILEQGAFKKTWRDMDVEELARIIVSVADESRIDLIP